MQRTCVQIDVLMSKFVCYFCLHSLVSLRGWWVGDLFAFDLISIRWFSDILVICVLHTTVDPTNNHSIDNVFFSIIETVDDCLSSPWMNPSFHMVQNQYFIINLIHRLEKSRLEPHPFGRMGANTREPFEKWLQFFVKRLICVITKLGIEIK